MAALTVLIIRHAEKPGENWPGPGLTAEAQPDRKSLVVRGWQRAGAWAALFGSGRGGADYPKPDFVYAAQPDPYDGPLSAGGEPSQRPYETIRSLADRLGLKPVIRWAKGEESELVAEIT
ncbi:MAG TPA: histidine phosphatase family protein, partial [Acetobacteraceae bacterium]|nr:histidine phosphatase family protein [Acetobacteraceae bacterium]